MALRRLVIDQRCNKFWCKIPLYISIGNLLKKKKNIPYK